MPTIKCRECKHEMSSRADFCPHCGLRRFRNRNDGFALTMLLIVLVGGIAVTLLYMTGNQQLLKDAWNQFNGRPTQSASRNAQQTTQNDQEVWKQRSLNLVRSKVDDGNAQFANIYFNLPVSGGVQIPVLCGDIVYPDGVKRKFITSADTDMATLEGEQPNFAQLWQGLCVKQ
jgi:hypothetical protein